MCYTCTDTESLCAISLCLARHSCSGGPLRISQNPPQTVTIAVAHQGSLPHADTRSQQQQQPQQQPQQQQQQRTPRTATPTSSATATTAAASSHAATPTQQQQQQQRRLSSSGSGSSSVRVGPPRKLFSVPAVVPPTLAVLDYNGNLGAVDLNTGQCRWV
jgi:hypothetical protein